MSPPVPSTAPGALRNRWRLAARSARSPALRCGVIIRASPKNVLVFLIIFPNFDVFSPPGFPAWPPAALLGSENSAWGAAAPLPPSPIGVPVGSVGLGCGSGEVRARGKLRHGAEGTRCCSCREPLPASGLGFASLFPVFLSLWGAAAHLRAAPGFGGGPAPKIINSAGQLRGAPSG